MHTCVLTQEKIRIETAGNSLLIYQDSLEQRIPLEPLQRIIALHTLNVDSRTLGALQSKGIALICINSRHINRCVQVTGPSYQNAQRRMAQYHWFQHPHTRLELAKGLIMLRNQQQQAQLGQWPNQHRHLAHTTIKLLQKGQPGILNSNNSQTLLGVEGSQARAWFKAISQRLPNSWGFTKRIRRPPPDPFNALLSLSYTLAYSEAVRLCLRHGLDPWLGFWHRPCHGRYSLACDLMEPVRSDIDQWLLGLIHRQDLKPHDFSHNESGCQLKKAGRQRYYQAWCQFLPDLSQQLQKQVFTLAKWLHQHPHPYQIEQGTGP